MLLSAGLTQHQAHGQALFSGLKIPTYTKTTALGGVLNAHPDEKVNLFVQNPALLPGTEGNVSFQHTFYFADISASQLAYAHDFEKTGTLGFSLQYFDYGKIQGYDETGAATGEMNASDFAITTAYAHERGNFAMGINLKLAVSDMIDYFAGAVLMDIGGIFRHPERDLTVGMTIKNFGFIFSDYTPTSESYLPFDVQVGMAFKPEYMPLRFHLSGYNLTNFDTPYFNEINRAYTTNEEPGLFDRVFSHISLGAELPLGKHLTLMGGYNHLVRKELRLENRAATAGISYGLEVRVKNFEVAYSRAHYTAGMAINQIGLTVDLKEFSKVSL